MQHMSSLGGGGVVPFVCMIRLGHQFLAACLGLFLAPSLGPPCHRLNTTIEHRSLLLTKLHDSTSAHNVTDKQRRPP